MKEKMTHKFLNRDIIKYFLTLCLVLISTCALADTFILRDGSKISGKLISQNKKGITVSIPFGSLVIQWQELSEKTKNKINPSLFPVPSLQSPPKKNPVKKRAPSREKEKDLSLKNTKKTINPPKKHFIHQRKKPSRKKQFLPVTIKDNRIFVDNRLFFVKGICYNPFYPGIGAGAQAYASRPLKERKEEMQSMKKAGFNTIRIYGTMPPAFYDLAHEYGLKVIEPVLFPDSYLNIKNEAVLKECLNKATARVLQMKDHPSILMWSLWNDAPFNPSIIKKFGKRSVEDFFQKIYDAVKEVDSIHPVTGANMINTTDGRDMGCSFLDVIGCNSYLGLDYSGSAWEQANFSFSQAKIRVKSMASLSKKYKKPLIITETGCPTHVKYSRQGRVIGRQIKAIGTRLAGVCIFEWTDEWWKAGDINTQNKHIEEHWGILDAERKEKPAFAVIKKYFNAIPTQSEGYKAEYLAP